MKNAACFTLILLGLVISACDDKPTSVSENGSISFHLIADNPIGAEPHTVIFTGILKGKIDTLTMDIPAMCFKPTCDPREACRARIDDTTRVAKRYYRVSHTYTTSGEFIACMSLYSKDGILASDTVRIKVVESR